ncbi:MAG TPA: G/U mismatch-specific DNA glycosylase [Streptosporangiaceae bacterium]
MAETSRATAGSAGKRPTAADLEAARDTTIPDVLAGGLRVVFAGINPGLYSAATGHHFARPGNRFWPALHRSGFTPRQFRPDEQDQLLALGLGITNVAPRATARAAELTPAELREGALALQEKMGRLRPQWLAVLGVTVYRTAFGHPGAIVGPQAATAGPARLWVLPNPSGLNAHWAPAALAGEFARLRAQASGPPGPRGAGGARAPAPAA